MKNKYLFLIYFISCFFFSSFGQESYMYRLVLKDKGKPDFSIDKPEEFLSKQSVERRNRQGIAVDSTDLPIDIAYINQIVQAGVSVRVVSKWVKTVTVQCTDTAIISQILSLPFIESADMVWKGNLQYPGISLQQKSEPVSFLKELFNDVNIYGQAYNQISMLNGHLLHESGFDGQGMRIAVIDGGFQNCDVIDAFDKERIMDVRNFTHLNTSPFRIDQSHGTSVLSCMLSYKPGVIVGTAPKADYYLVMTEVGKEEYPVEEDYWIAGIEYADSIGVDIVNTSLGYTTFDASEMNHEHSQLDGKTVLISKAAGMAADKGLLLFNAAGNEGNKSWQKITFPADAENIITVGSVDENKNSSEFSSTGFTADGRVKPDLVAMGSRATMINASGATSVSWGTSFSSPILAGVAACLWQALPELTNLEIIDLMKKNGDRYECLDSIYGYGIPDMYRAYSDVSSHLIPVKENVLFVNATSNRLYININPDETFDCRLTIYNSLGRRVMNRSQLSESIDISNLSKGVYIVHIECKDKQFAQKIIKL